MSTVEKVRVMLALCEMYALNGRDFITQFPLEVLASDYNGIGPEWFPQVLRDIIDDLAEDLQPAAFIHDVRWSHSDGTLLSFKASNEEFAANCKKIAFAKYGWWRPKRYRLWRTGVLFARICTAFGLPAYYAAYRLAHPQEEQTI